MSEFSLQDERRSLNDAIGTQVVETTRNPPKKPELKEAYTLNVAKFHSRTLVSTNYTQ